MKLTAKQKFAYGIGAVGKDMVYALTASFVMYYYQDILGLSATFVGTILMIARVFDAVNDPLTGIIVGRSHSRWGRYRPWVFAGTVDNAFVLYALFAAPHYDSQAKLMVYFAAAYILWGTTYDFMDIPYWAMIPAVTETPRDREDLSVIGRTCAGVGNAIITVGALKSVYLLGGGDEREGFRLLALIVAVLFVIDEAVCALWMRERRDVRLEKPAGVREMLSSLVHNDQALVTALTIILINLALYLTSNFIIYFFKYDFGGAGWRDSYTLFTTVGGACQILGMMLVYPLLRKRGLANEKIFLLAIGAALAGYLLILGICFLGGAHNLVLLCLPGALVFGANGILTILTTVFLSASVDWGQAMTGRREESVIFSMQTFVVKAASGVAVFLAGLGIDLIGLTGDNSLEGAVVVQSAGTIAGLRLMMTVLPIAGLAAAALYFRKRFKLTDEYCRRLTARIHQKEENHEPELDRQ